MLLCPNTVVNIPNEMARKRKLFNFGMIKRLAMPLNVGKRANGKTFIGGINDSGNHWALALKTLIAMQTYLKGNNYKNYIQGDNKSNELYNKLNYKLS